MKSLPFSIIIAPSYIIRPFFSPWHEDFNISLSGQGLFAEGWQIKCLWQLLLNHPDFKTKTIDLRPILAAQLLPQLWQWILMGKGPLPHLIVDSRFV